MSFIHFRDRYPHPSGICGEGWQDGTDENSQPVKATRTEERVDCPKCLSSLHPGRKVARHGKVTVSFDPGNLLGNVQIRLRGTGPGGAETTVEVPLIHYLDTALKMIQAVGEVGADLLRHGLPDPEKEIVR
ncbi:MAG: hypothetical protein HOY78_02635 [Saccharothrix sp.]|nr:hypothetical protein [Saccharothrix sp.]